MLRLTSRRFFEATFLPYFGPLALLGLLYTIVVMFAYQGHHTVHNLGPVFRVFVPLVLYFIVMWSAAFALVWWCGRRVAARNKNNGADGEGQESGTESEVEGRMRAGHSATPVGGGSKKAEWSYEMAVVQSFTAASNNFVSTVFLLMGRRRMPILFAFPGACHSSHDRGIRSRLRPSSRRDDWAAGGGSRPAGSHMGSSLAPSATEVVVDCRCGGGEQRGRGDQTTRRASDGHDVGWCGRGRPGDE